MQNSELPTGKLSRRVRVVMEQAEGLAVFVEALESRGEVDPSAPVVASSMGSLYARLEQAVSDARDARDLAAFFVRAGRGSA